MELLERTDRHFSYRNLFEASGLFEGDYYAYNDAWLKARLNVDWANLHGLPIEKVRVDVIGFLNKWKCRLSYSDSLAEGIIRAHLDSLNFIETLGDETIEDWEPDGTKEINGQYYTNSELLHKIYNRFASVGERFSNVAASKVLHFLLPNLVVMWDNRIASSYRITMTSRRYVSSFIPKMKEMANKAIESYRKEKGCNRKEASLALNRFRPPKTIAKLLDEYNYMRFTRGIDTGGHTPRPDNALKEGNNIQVRAIEGRDGRVISRAPDGRVILFDNTGPRSARVKSGDIVHIIITSMAENYLIVRLAETSKPLDTGPRNKPDLFEAFEEYKRLRNFKAGEGIIEASVDSWMAARRRAKDRYREMFNKENLEKMSADEFISFLYFKNNRAWTQLYRQGLQLTNDMNGLKEAIEHTQDESIDVKTRIRDVLRGGRLHPRGFGKNMATGILHTCDGQDQYGLWNNRTEEALKILKRKPPISQDLGLSYTRINNKLLRLKRELGTDLVILDGFMWYVSKFHSEI